VIEELMLLANELVARWLTERNVPTIFRVHGKPDEEKLAKLAVVAELLGAPFDVEEMSNPKVVSKWLQHIAEHPRRGVLEGLLLRSLKQAAYDVVNVGHFGLASDAYLHFTSPIRRYPDLLVHRTIKRILNGEKPDNSPAGIEALKHAASTSSSRERATMAIEREVMDLYRALYMKDHTGEMFEGMVGSVVGSGVFVQVNEPFVDVLVRYESLGDERFQLSDDELSLVAPRSGDRIVLGDPITIEIEDVSIVRRQVYGRRVAVRSHDVDSEAARSTGAGRRPRRGDQNVAARGASPRATTARRPGAPAPRAKPGRGAATPVRGKKPKTAASAARGASRPKARKSRSK
jgi:ribonuclease R